jgi:hypothetical protein
VDHGVGLHEVQAVLPAVVDGAHQQPEPAVAVLEARMGDLALEDGELLA